MLLTMFFVTGSAAAQVDDKAALAKLNEEVVNTYKVGKFNEALKLAQQVLDATVRTYGENDIQTAVAYSNLGLIQVEKDKTAEAAANLQKAVEIFEKLDSKDAYGAALRLANIYARDKEFEKADEFYLKSSVRAAKYYGIETKEFQQVEGIRVCSGWNISMLEKRDKAFYERRKELLGDAVKFEFGILNKNAKSLPKPKYPSEARSQRLGGVIPVKVKIDQQGNVAEVTAICGHPSLSQATTDAVKNAKFEPFTVDGQPSIANGLVIYSYIP